MRSRLIAAPAAAILLALTAACGSSTSPAPATSKQTITVFAAASLKEPFTVMKKAFEARYPHVKVAFNFAGSPTLVTQVNEGASVDVLATASTKTMAGATSALAPRAFATNALEIAVPRANPGPIAALADLTRPGVKVAVCQAAVPCGAVATTVLDKAKLTLTPATEETDVTAVLTKVALGEVDAGLVYVTDVRGDSSVKGIEIPAAQNAITTYPIAVLKSSTHAAAAREFVAFVLGPQGQTILANLGWGRP